MDRNWALCEVQLAYDEVDRLFSSVFETRSRMIDHGPTYRRKASRGFEGRAGSCWAYRWPFATNYDWQCFLKLANDTRAAINTWGLRNRVAWIEKPHSMHGARHTAGVGCIPEQSRWKRPHEVFGSPWAGSAVWREWNHRYWEESKTSKRGQC